MKTLLENKLEMYHDILYYYKTHVFDETERASFDGICDRINMRHSKVNGVCHKSLMRTNFPELLKYKPHRTYCSMELWWRSFNTKSRIRVLNNIINDLKTQINEERTRDIQAGS